MKDMIEYIHCPYCQKDDSFPWATEMGLRL